MSPNGVIAGPERPAFEVRPGEAVYLGIWQVEHRRHHRRDASVAA